MIWKLFCWNQKIQTKRDTKLDLNQRQAMNSTWTTYTHTDRKASIQIGNRMTTRAR